MSYPIEVKEHALGMLYASAEVIDGDLFPNFGSTSKKTGASIQTLMNWWEGRDRGADITFLEAATRARAKAAEKASRQWYDDLLGELRNRINELAVDDARWAKEPAADAARGMKALTEAAEKLPALYGMSNVDDAGGGNTGGDPAALDGAVRRMLERARPPGS